MKVKATVRTGQSNESGLLSITNPLHLYIGGMLSDIPKTEGIHIGGKKINCVGFADYMVILTKDTKGMQYIMAKLEEGVKERGMKINAGKTKITRPNETENIKNINQRFCFRSFFVYITMRTPQYSKTCLPLRYEQHHSSYTILLYASECLHVDKKGSLKKTRT